MITARGFITESYKPLCSHNFVADEQEHMPELATNETWRGIMARARKTHGLTQGQLGDDVGLSQVMISKLETGESESSTFILRICRRLSIAEPQHFANERDRHWAELGHLLRLKATGQYDATTALVESMLKKLEDAEAANDETTEPQDRRK